MAKHTLSKNAKSTWEIGTSGTWIVNRNATMSITALDGIGIHEGDMASKNVIKVNGDIKMFDGETAAISIGGDNTRVRIGGSSDISALNGVVVEATSSSATVMNYGVIHAQVGMSAKGAATAAHFSNRGKIDSYDTGMESQGVDSTLNNYGVISGDYGMVTNETGAKIVNNGKIHADTSIVMLGNGSTFTNDVHGVLRGYNGIDVQSSDMNGVLTIVNKGVIIAVKDAVMGNNAALHITNRGTIYGDVTMSTGDDIFDTSSGQVNGTIYGGLGDDVITLRTGKELYSENINQGTDTVRVTATATLNDYSLGANIENLVLLGRKAIAGTGNPLDNTITGNSGDNTIFTLDGKDVLDGKAGDDYLDGGDGQDVFVFRTGYDADQIANFNHNDDTIDMRGSGIADFAGLTGKVSEVSMVGVVIDLGGGDTLTLKGVVLANIDATDFMFV